MMGAGTFKCICSANAGSLARWSGAMFRPFLFVLEIFLAFGIAACSMDHLEMNSGQFDLPAEELNLVPPEDVLEEVVFYGQGGGDGDGFCDKARRPMISNVFSDKQIEQGCMIDITSCGWQALEKVKVTIFDPAGAEIFQQDVISENLADGLSPRIFLSHSLPLDAGLGLYRIELTGNNGRVAHLVKVEPISSSRLIVLDDQLQLLNFVPGEKIRLFVYEISSSAGFGEFSAALSGWTIITANSVGEAIVDPEFSFAEKEFVAIGEVSGEVHRFNPYFCGESPDGILTIRAEP